VAIREWRLFIDGFLKKYDRDLMVDSAAGK